MDDEDAFLYGDGPPAVPASLPEAVKPAISGASEPAPYEPAPPEEDEDGEVEMDEEDSESDIEITLEADPNAPAPAGYRPPLPAHLRQPVTISSPGALPAVFQDAKSRPDVPLLRPSPDPRQGTPPAPMTYQASGLPLANVVTPAVVDDGESLLDVDIDDLPDHPWRKAGTVLADYFNYGFDEATWKAYCARQKASRAEREKEKELPFSVFATLPLAEAFEALHNEQRNALMHTIAAHYAISFGEEGATAETNGTPPVGVSPLPPAGRGGPMNAFGVPIGQAAPGRGRGAPQQQARQSSDAGSDRPPIPTRGLSPLPNDIPTGPRNSRPPPPSRPRGHIDYRDSDLQAGTSAPTADTLDYGLDAPEEAPKPSRDHAESGHRERRRRRSRRSSEEGEANDDMSVDEPSRSSRRSGGSSRRDRDDRRRESDRKESSSKRRRDKDDDRESTSSRRDSKVKLEEGEDEDDLADVIEKRSRGEATSSRSKRSKH